MESCKGEVLVCCLVSALVRWAVSLGDYSGKGIPPLYGDYEAQRHWQEITVNLPVQEWYHNTSDNDLMYWGLDYPPLTAYHSWALGKVAREINPAWVSLHESRGFESATHKLFMRYSVLLGDLLLFIPGVLVYMLTATKWKSRQEQILLAATVLLYPGLIIIDYGHFQYNSISLGLTLWAVTSLYKGHDLIGSFFFCLALNYKQMELYHALPFFFYLLGSAFRGKENWFVKLVKIGLVVLGAFGICWLPFLQDKDTALQVLHRLFPFARGLYEDKVSNVWCTLSVVIKLKELLTVQQLLRLCLGSTLLSLLPSGVHLLFRPTTQNFKIALVNSSLVFFLFSFQVHEKSILLAALPVCLLLPDVPFPSVWFLLISTFSMMPLLIKDGLLLQTAATVLLFYVCYLATQSQKPQKGFLNRLLQITFFLSIAGAVALTVCSVTLTPPPRLPDLFPLLVSVYSCGHFVIFLVYFHYLQFSSYLQEEERAAQSAKMVRKKKQ